MAYPAPPLALVRAGCALIRNIVAGIDPEDSSYTDDATQEDDDYKSIDKAVKTKTLTVRGGIHLDRKHIVYQVQLDALLKLVCRNLWLFSTKIVIWFWVWYQLYHYQYILSLQYILCTDADKCTNIKYQFLWDGCHTYCKKQILYRQKAKYLYLFGELN